MSFALKAYTTMLSSNLFYPSNYKERPIDISKDHWTITCAKIDIFEREPVANSRVDKCFRAVGKCFRALARAIGIYAIGIFLAPLGTVYHLRGYLFNRGLYCIGSTSDKSEFEGHYDALKVDLFTATIFGGSTALAFLSGGMFAVTSASHAIVFVARLALAGLSVGAISPKLGASFLSLPLNADPHYESSCNGLITVIRLKNHFGISEKNGKLLSYSFDYKFFEGISKNLYDDCQIYLKDKKRSEKAQNHFDTLHKITNSKFWT